MGPKGTRNFKIARNSELIHELCTYSTWLYKNTGHKYIQHQNVYMYGIRNMSQAGLNMEKEWFVSWSALFSGQQYPSTFSQARGGTGQCQTGLPATSKLSQMHQQLVMETLWVGFRFII